MDDIEKRIKSHIINYKQGCNGCRNKGDYCNQCMVIDVCNAFEKQMPKKIDHDYISCNSCDGDLEVFARMDIKCCPWCGQRLDWTE